MTTKIMSKILALDQSSRVTGYAILEGEELIESGRLSYANTDPIKRINRLKKKVEELIVKYDVQKVYLEDVFLNTFKKKGRSKPSTSQVKGFKTSCKVLGVLEGYLFEKGIEYEVVMASVWRKPFGFNKGKAGEDIKKERAVEYVKEKFSIDAGPDEAEAICIGLYGAGK